MHASCHFGNFAPDLRTLHTELLITMYFPEISDGNQLYLGMTNFTDDILAGVEPVEIVPGYNLRGLGSVSVKWRILNQEAATFGVLQVSHREALLIFLHKIMTT